MNEWQAGCRGVAYSKQDGDAQMGQGELRIIKIDKDTIKVQRIRIVSLGLAPFLLKFGGTPVQVQGAAVLQAE